jgi:hypothetical protein
MLTRLFFVFFIVVLQQNVLGRLLGCTHCDHLIDLNYIITADYFPYGILRGCAFLNSQQSCTIELQIDLDKNQTIMNVTGSQEYVETSIEVIETIENGLQHKRHLSFWCSDPHAACNTEHYLQRVLRSVSIEGSFKELEPLLIPTNQTIDNSSCLVFSNTTASECQSECSDDNKACYIESLTNAEESFEVCARCSSMKDYHLMYSMTFFTGNLSIPQSDHRVLSCAVPQCNSIVNLERIGKLMTIDFNETTFFDVTTTTVVVPTTTTSISSGPIFWINNFGKYYTVSIILAILLVYNILLS